MSVIKNESVHLVTSANRASNPKGLKNVPNKRQMSFRLIVADIFFLFMVTVHVSYFLSPLWPLLLREDSGEENSYLFDTRFLL